VLHLGLPRRLERGQIGIAEAAFERGDLDGLAAHRARLAVVGDIAHVSPRSGFDTGCQPLEYPQPFASRRSLTANLPLEDLVMAVDRYVKTILTIIALELFWIGIKDTAPPVIAQAALTPVVIRGIQLPPRSEEYLPVGIVGQPLRVDTVRPVKIEADRPIKIEADRALKVENVGYTPSKNPGE
jgi:hypothetical protein